MPSTTPVKVGSVVSLWRYPGILRAAAQHNQVNVGVYASVAQGGTIRRVDPVRLE